MFINDKREIYALAHLNLSTAMFKYIAHMFYAINKHSNFCCFKALAYTNLDRQCAVFLYIIFAVLIKFVGRRGITN